MLAPVAASGELSPCAICFEEITPLEQLSIKCNHVFHEVCLLKWLPVNNSCPVCRMVEPLTAADAERLLGAQPSSQSAPITWSSSSDDSWSDDSFEEFLDERHSRFPEENEIYAHALNQSTYFRNGSTPFYSSLCRVGEYVIGGVGSLLNVFHSGPVQSAPVEVNALPMRFRAGDIADLISVCKRLQHIADLLSSDFDQACAEMMALNETGHFPITQTYSGTANVAQNIFFHLYQIHLFSKKFNGDFDYGRKAFFNIDGCGADNDDRIRCIQRVMVEMILSSLKHCFKYNCFQEAGEFLNILETCDRVMSNPAHFLYSEFYNLNCEPFMRPAHLPSVSNPIYKGEFGKIAFRNELGYDDECIFQLRSETIIKLQTAMSWWTRFNRPANRVTTTTTPQIRGNCSRYNQVWRLKYSHTESSMREAYNDLDDELKVAIKSAIWRLNNSCDEYEGMNRCSFYDPNHGLGLGGYIVSNSINCDLFRRAVQDVIEKYT